MAFCPHGSRFSKRAASYRTESEYNTEDALNTLINMIDSSKGQRTDSAPNSAESNRTKLEDMPDALKTLTNMIDSSEGQSTKSAPNSAASNRTELEDMPNAVLNDKSSFTKISDSSEGQRTESTPNSAASNRTELEDMMPEEVSTSSDELTGGVEVHDDLMPEVLTCRISIDDLTRLNEEHEELTFQKIHEALELLQTVKDLNQDYSEWVSTAISLFERKPRSNIVVNVLQALTFTDDCKHIRFTEAMDVFHSVERKYGRKMSKALGEAFLELRRVQAIVRLNASEVEKVIERLKCAIERCAKKEAEKTRYDTSGKRGLLCFIQHKQPNWERGNKRDKDELLEYFKDTLGFDVQEYSSYDELDSNLETDYILSSEQYYCLVICISGHGNQKEVATKTKIHHNSKGEITVEVLKSIPIQNIIKRFSNQTIPTLAGVPKIIILETCRGDKDNKTISKSDTSNSENRKKSVSCSPTTDSDCLVVHATTHGHCANIPDEGSVGLQGVMKALNANWKNDHLQEMLIDASNIVAEWGTDDERQTLETTSTLTKRLYLVKSD